MASSFETVSTWSTRERSRFFGTKPAPMPWILCGPGTTASPARVCVMTGEWVGSTATLSMALPLVRLRYRDTPVMVPPVPTPATSTSTSPPVSAQISGPVVLSWMAGLAGFSNCRMST